MIRKKSLADPISRRNFLTISAAVPAVVVAQSLGMGASTASAQGVVNISNGPGPAMSSKKPSVGLELYSVRTELGHDLPKTLTAVSKMGYEAVEFYAPYA